MENTPSILTFEKLESRVNKQYIDDYLKGKLDIDVRFLNDLKSTSFDKHNLEDYLSVVNGFQNYSPTRLMICGHSGAGKDYVTRIILNNYTCGYFGPSSLLLCSMLYPEDVYSLYVNRHQYKKLLFEFGNILRESYKYFIPKYLWSHGNIISGMRGKADIEAAREIGCVPIWINPIPGVKPDSTLDYTFDDLTKMFDQIYVVNNIFHDDLFVRVQIDYIMKALDIENGRIKEDWSRFGVNFFEIR